MVSITSTSKLMLVLFAVTACGQFQSNKIVKAPASQEEARSRVIIKGSDAATKAVLESSESFRVLSAKHNIYEVQGLEPEEVREIAPTIEASRNQYFESMIESKATASIYEKYASMTPTAAANFGPKEIPPALKGCDLSAKIKPIAKVSVKSNVLATSATMNLGETVSFAGTKSLSQLDDDTMEIRWDLIAPKGSSLRDNLKTASDFPLTPDSVGMYQLVLVAKSSDNACGVKVIRFFVTHNPKIQLPSDEDVRKYIPIEKFEHLGKINVESAWKKATGQGVTIAVLDTGLNYNHDGIKFNLAINEKEMSGTDNTDDDENTFEDDVLGWDFINGDNKPFDDEGHGSHVGGLTSSHVNGSAPDSKILPIKVMNAGGGGDTASLIAGIYYAVDNGALVINVSMQRLTKEIPALQDAVNYANSKGVVFISAAGNDGLDLSSPVNQIYPGELDAPNVVNIAATGFDDSLTSYSNYGQIEVDVAAPGGDQKTPIFSLATQNTLDNVFVPSGGTSMAAPIVAGVAALMLEVNPNLTPEQIREILMTSGESLDSLKDVVGSGKLLDADIAVAEAEKLNIEQALF